MSIDRGMLIHGALACVGCVKAGIAIVSDKPARDGATAPHWSNEGGGNPARLATVRAA